jgi:Protein of unknown function (DUF1559)/BlaR1 peptidase M56
VNALGLVLLGSIVHATGFALLGSLFYLGLRRWSPAAGALAAGSSLVIMSLVSIVVLSPWPQWWIVAWAEPGGAPTSDAREAEPIGTPPIARLGTQTTPGPERTERVRSTSATLRNEPSATPPWINSFFDELSRPELDPERTRWDWREWVLAGFLASLSVGLARLGLGFWAIRRLRARSVPVVDKDLDETVEVLRAELSCLRKVEFRETSELATPATIGWWQPLLFLPADWREWNADERRAVLAHELAHVCRGDFLAGLVAQLSLALHYYHPLAHWLAARLRLEQELAADAWSARLSGGTQTYLATLARMALRREKGALTWPARAFLPSRSTFVRRIEMLRHTNPIRHASLSRATRLITIGFLAVLGLLVSGLRGPDGGEPARAQAQAPAKTDIASSARPASEPYNLAFLPADTKMVLAIRPATLVRRREVRSLLESFRQTPAGKAFVVVPPEDMEQVLAFWEGSPQAPVEPGRTPLISPPSGAVFHMTKPQDWKTQLTQLLGSPPVEARHDGQTYYGSPGPVGQRWCAFTPDDRTLVLAQDDLLRELIEDRNAPAPRHPWDELWKKAVQGQVMLAFETRWLRRRMAQGFRGGPPAPGQSPIRDLTLETISPLLDKARSYAIAFDSSEGLTVDLIAGAGSEDDAKVVANTLQALLTLGRNAFQGFGQELRGRTTESGEAMQWIVQAGDSLLDKARVETTGTDVRLQAKSSLDLAEGIKLLAPAVKSSQIASRRMSSVNHLKQIALAFHNYHSQNGCFPAPVLYGGKSGTVPYSWRVAILPYLEGQELYNRYDFDEPWDGPNNRKLLDKMPAVYGYPGLDGSPLSQSHSAYFVFTGEGTAVGPAAAVALKGATGFVAPGSPGAGGKAGSPVVPAKPAGPTINDITDGTSNTILAVEANREIPWTKPEDIPFNPNGPLADLGGFSPDGFNAVFADGSVRYIKKSINPKVLKALITKDGGEPISNDQY